MNFENHFALGDVNITIPTEMAQKAITVIKGQPDSELLMEMLGLDGAAFSEPKCTKHGVVKSYATSGYYCKACKSSQQKAKRERKNAQSKLKDK